MAVSVMPSVPGALLASVARLLPVLLCSGVHLELLHLPLGALPRPSQAEGQLAHDATGSTQSHGGCTSSELLPQPRDLLTNLSKRLQ